MMLSCVALYAHWWSVLVVLPLLCRHSAEHSQRRLELADIDGAAWLRQVAEQLQWLGLGDESLSSALCIVRGRFVVAADVAS